MGNLNDLLQKTHESVNYSCAESCDENPGAEGGCISCLGDQYFGEKAIDYSCEHKRSAYVLRYLPVHIQEVNQVLDGLRDSQGLPASWPDPVRVLSIGGGPGSDIAAFKKFISEGGFYDDDAHKFQIYRLEKVEDWNNIATEVIHLFSPKGYEFDHKKINNDLNNLPKCAKGPFDVFLLSYVVSELNDAECDRLGKAIDALSGDRAVVIFNDRNQDSVWQKIQVIASQLNEVDSFKRTAEEWCGLHYPDDLKGMTLPKLYMKSVRYGLVIQK